MRRIKRNYEEFDPCKRPYKLAQDLAMDNLKTIVNSFCVFYDIVICITP